MEMTFKQVMTQYSCPRGKRYAKAHGWSLLRMLDPVNAATYNPSHSEERSDHVSWCACHVLRVATSSREGVTEAQRQALHASRYMLDFRNSASIIELFTAVGITQLDGPPPSWWARTWTRLKSARVARASREVVVARGRDERRTGMTMKRSVLVAVLGTLLTASVAHAQWYDLDIVVLDGPHQTPLVGATVVLMFDEDVFGNGLTRVTDGNGFVNFGVWGTVNYSVTAAGFLPQPGQATGPGGRREHHLTPTGVPPPPPGPTPWIPGQVTTITHEALVVTFYDTGSHGDVVEGWLEVRATDSTARGWRFLRINRRTGEATGEPSGDEGMPYPASWDPYIGNYPDNRRMMAIDWRGIPCLDGPKIREEMSRQRSIIFLRSATTVGAAIMMGAPAPAALMAGAVATWWQLVILRDDFYRACNYRDPA